MRHEIRYQFQSETEAAIVRLDPKCVDAQSMCLGIDHAEPLLMCMDALLRYAKAYEARFGSKLADDGYLGDGWLSALKGVHDLLNGDGAVAMERGITTDSKCNGVMEDIFWAAMSAAGFKDETATVEPEPVKPSPKYDVSRHASNRRNLR